MKTYPITDHVPESELLAITQAGAERWLTAHGWTRLRIPIPVTGAADYADVMASAVGRAAFVSRTSPRAVIAEMQADSRIVEAGRKVASR